MSIVRSWMLRCLLLLVASPATVAATTAAAVDSLAAEETAPTWDRPLPFLADWAIDRGIDLPNPFGAGIFLVYTARDIAIDDVHVTLEGDEPVSISDAASFDLRNGTTLAALKLDAWILPVFNVYALLGRTWTDSNMGIAVTIDPIIGGPITIESDSDTETGGPFYGGGATLVAGHGRWFIMGDANYTYSILEEFDGSIDALFLSGRTGWSGDLGWGGWRAWVGAAYLDADRVLTITTENRLLGEVIVEVDQRPRNPLTYELGASTTIGRRWEALLEVGSNFDDAFLLVFSGAYRF
jgi:hypothetical protein